MAITASFNPATGVLSVFGDSLLNSIEASRNVAGQILINGGAVPVTGGTPTVANTTQIQVYGQGGSDTVTLSEINGALPGANLFGGLGNDILTGGSANDLIFGQSDQDTLFGKAGADYLFGGDSDDTLTGGDGDDQMFGEGGNDRMIWNPGDDSDLIEGGDGTDTAEVNGGNGTEIFTLSANGTRVRFDRIDPAPFSLDIGTTEEIVIFGNGGSDSFSATGNLAPLIHVTFDGGAGEDNILGSNGDDKLIGGTDNDFVDGNQGNDTVSLGTGDDRFQWDPGDGSDIVEGEADFDTLLFNGSNISENIYIDDNGGRVRLFRNIGNVVMDLNGVESLQLAMLGGADFLALGDLSSTGVVAAGIDLRVAGAGDGQTDAVSAAGSALGDVINVTSILGVTQVVGLAASVQILGMEAFDRLIVSGEAGADFIDASTVPLGAMLLTLNGGTGNDTLIGTVGDDVFDGGADIDTVRLAGAGSGVTVSLALAGPQAIGGGLGTDTFNSIENLVGTAYDDVLSGTNAVNQLTGGAGSDRLDGGGAIDIMTGEGGSDVYIANMIGDLTIETNADIAVGGYDTVYFTGVTGTFTLSANIERLVLSGAAAINGTGNALVNTVYGNSAANILDGGVDLVGDALYGNGGDDVYIIRNASDNIIETAGQGTGDRAQVTTSFALGAGDNIEFLETTNAAGTGAINLTGNEIAQTVTGNAGSNVLNGGSDAVADILVGGLGNDTYVINTVTDDIVELAGGGTADRALASVSYTLGIGDFVEFLETTNAAGIGAINLTGNTLSQTIIANASANILDGGLDTVADTLVGGLGNDIYVINTANDNIVELAGGGTADRARASLSFALAAGDNIEFLETTNAAGTAAINLVGNEIAQSITGNAGTNVLNGGIDALADTLAGGLGDDQYVINSANDVIVELNGQGNADRVLANLSYVLAAGASIEIMTTGNAALTTAINLTGNELAQTIGGNAGANTINGSLGNDTLMGGLGSDFFVFNTGLNAALNVDVILDFNVAADTIRLENAIFTALGAATGVLGSAMFKNLTTGGPVDTDDRILYNDATGAIFYDSDGSGNTAAIQFATLSGSPTVDQLDFVVI